MQLYSNKHWFVFFAITLYTIRQPSGVTDVEIDELLFTQSPDSGRGKSRFISARLPVAFETMIIQSN